MAGEEVKKLDENPYSLLRRHCRMYLYGASGSPELLVNEAARDFFTFAFLHLVCTMFIIADKKNGKNGEIFHRILDPLGKSNLLTDIDRILSLPLGRTNLKQYLRSKRNKLATHGSLAFSSQGDAIIDVTFDEKNLNQYEQAMKRLDLAVYNLDESLKGIENQ